MSDNFSEVIHTRIWQEQAEPDNPFAAALCRCHGYDVYGQLLGKASYIEYLYLLLKGERPGAAAASSFEILAVALANPGPRDPSVHAAMATGATGTPASSSLMAAIAAGAGGAGGAREVLLAMQTWADCGTDLEAWLARLAAPVPNHPLFWPQAEHAPGFDPHGVRCATPVLQLLAALSAILPEGRLAWLAENRAALEQASGTPLAQNGVVAAAFADLGLTPAQGEMFTLLWRLPGAAVHALEQTERGFKQFPFFELALENDPGPQRSPQQQREAA
ncbi:citrate/2-methylcitrate synthase [Pseudoduganella namucuonensis]|uniref:Citrate synthase n=1 Tax=Pseudoduganella namucuonensis TaxID=1035707 RepID=A0A1I7HEX7_9BURK|nr:citrate/2-methylcitrate synthase [Pseudoduganella namucuonensis]SFU59275.1 citrate synthase [Pseudoduganella namucuonensis]